MNPLFGFSSLQHLPALFAAVMVGGSVLLGGALRVIPFTLFGTYAAWAYLRFLQSRDGARCVSASALAAAVLAAINRHLPGEAIARAANCLGACLADCPGASKWW